MARTLFRLLVRAMVCALLGVGLHVFLAPAVTAAPVAGTLVASPASSVVGAAEQDTLDGSLPPARARTVQLQRRIDTGGWAFVQSKKSTSNGTFRFTPVIPTNANSEVSYRVLAPAATLGGRLHGAVETPSVTLGVTPQVSSLHVPSRVLVGTTYTAEAIFSPARPGRSVVLQRRSGGRWTNVATATQDATGTAVFQRAATSVGNETLRALAQRYRRAAAKPTTAATVSALSSGDVIPPAVPWRSPGDVRHEGAVLGGGLRGGRGRLSRLPRRDAERPVGPAVRRFCHDSFPRHPAPTTRPRTGTRSPASTRPETSRPEPSRFDPPRAI